jgi:hypothetical protein
MTPAKYFEPKLITQNVTSNTMSEELEAFTCKGYARRDVMVRLGFQLHILARENSCHNAALQTS